MQRLDGDNGASQRGTRVGRADGLGGNERGTGEPGCGGGQGQAPAAVGAQAQFAGYFAADAQGYYKAENLEVDFLDGGPTIVPQQVGSAPDGPEFTISWVPKVLEARESAPTSSTSPRSSSARAP